MAKKNIIWCYLSPNFTMLNLCNQKVKLHQSSHSKTSTTDDQVDAIHCIVLGDICLTVQQIVKSIGITSGSVHTVLTEILEMGKLSSRWFLRMLTSEHKTKRVDISWTLLTHSQANPKNFQDRLVTHNKTWVHHFEPQSKIQSKQQKL